MAVSDTAWKIYYQFGGFSSKNFMDFLIFQNRNKQLYHTHDNFALMEQLTYSKLG